MNRRNRWITALLLGLGAFHADRARADALGDLGLSPPEPGQPPRSILVEIGGSGCAGCSSLSKDYPGKSLPPFQVLRLNLDDKDPRNRDRIRALTGSQLNDVTDLPYTASFTIDDKGVLHKTGRLLGYSKSCFENWAGDAALAQVPAGAKAVSDGVKELNDPDGGKKGECHFPLQGGTTAINEGYETRSCPGKKRLPISPFCDETSMQTTVAPACDGDTLKARAQLALREPAQLRAIACHFDHRFGMDGWKHHRMRKGLTRGEGSGESVMVEQFLSDLIHTPAAGRESMMKQLRDVKAHDPDADIGLVLATTYREAESVNPFMSSSPKSINTYYSGGLDFLGSDLPTMRARKYIPPGYGKSWKVAPQNLNENGNTAKPAEIPTNEQVAAYGATFHYRRDEFRDRALDAGFTQADVDKLSPQAKRAWVEICFMGTHGYRYGTPAKPGQHRVPGVLTVLTHLKALIDKGEAKSLDDLLTLPKLSQYEIVRRGLISLSDAEMIDRVLNARGDCAKK